MEISFEYSIWFIPLCVLLAAVYAFTAYYKSKDSALWSERPILKWVLPLLRFSLVLILMIQLLGPLLQFKHYDKMKAELVLAVDNSASITPNAEEDLKQLILEIEKELELDYKVKTVFIGERARAAEWSKLDFSDQSSDLSQLFKYQDESLQTELLKGSVLISDGIENRGESAAQRSINSKIPVYTLGLGDTSVQSDASIESVRMNSLVYLGNQFKIGVDISADLLQGKSAPLSVKQNGRIISTTLINYTKASDYQEIEVSGTANRIGLNRIDIALDVSPSEINPYNNRRTIFYEVVESRKKIALWSRSIHPDISAIKSALESKDEYQLEIVQDPNDFTVDQQDLVILYDWCISQQDKTLFNLLRTASIPTLLVLSTDFNPSIFNELEVSMQFEGLGSGINNAQPEINAEFGHFQVPPKIKIEQWPPLEVRFGRMTGFQSEDVLLNQNISSVSTSEPLLACKNELNYRYAVLMGKGIWRWRMEEFRQDGEHMGFHEMLSDIVQFLTVKQTAQLLSLRTAENVYSDRESVKLIGELYNSSLQAVEQAEISVGIYSEGKELMNRLMSPKGSAYVLHVKGLSEGSYQFKGTAEVAGKELESSGSFQVVSSSLEKLEMQADHKLLRTIASNSGGSFDRIDNWKVQIAQLKNELGTSIILKEQREWRSLIDLKALFFALLTLMSVEWFTRKFIGGY